MSGCGAGSDDSSVPPPANERSATAPSAPTAPGALAAPAATTADDMPQQVQTERSASGADEYVGQRLGQNFAKWSATAEEHCAGARQRDEVGSVTGQFSWLVELLPFIGHQAIYDDLDFAKGWTERANIAAAIQVIPEFQNPLDERRRWQGFPFDGLGLSHFVGVSGVERRRLDVAANYERGHPDAGIFGYDRIMRPQEVTDGRSQTLALIGSGELAGPWIQAGGATVRGARQPYFDAITGFGSRGVAGGTGAVAMTADGAARFLSSAIDPQVFAALCTAHGGENVNQESVPLSHPVPIPEDQRQRFQLTKLAE